MKYLLFLFIFSFFLQISLSAQEENTGIIFYEGNWEGLITKAKKDKKIIFVDAYTSWCGPCKRMSKEVFPNKDVGKYYNKHFICYQIDMEKGEGPMIAQKFNINCYPQLLFLDTNQNIVHRAAGSRSAEEFISLGRTSLNQKENYQYHKNLFEKDNENIENGFAYLELKKSSCLSTKEELDIIAQQLNKNNNLQTETNHKKLLEHEILFPSIAFNYILSHEEAIIIATSEYQYLYIIGNATKDAIQKHIIGEAETKTQIEEILNDTTQTEEKIQDFLMTSQINQKYNEALKIFYFIHLYSNDLASHVNTLYNYVQNYYFHYTFIDYYFYYITKYAEIIINYSEDKEKLQNVDTWLTEAIKQYDWDESHYQLARVKFILGDYSEALTEAKEFKKRVEKDEDDTQKADNLINKINKKI